MSDYEEAVKNIMTQLSGANVDAIFGQPRNIDGKAVIPVGKISYGWGGGGGKGEKKRSGAEGDEEGQGSGIGMGMKVRPIGFITLADGQVTYKPIIDKGPMTVVFSIFAGIISLKLLRTFSKLLKSSTKKRT